MSSIREKYFELKKIDSKYLNENIIKQLLMLVNDIESDFDLLTSFDNECKKLDLLNSYVEEIIKGKPFQYVIGKSYFCNHEFYIDENVLIPRNETEELVKLTLEHINKIYNRQNVQIFDVCTGSGCIGISLKLAIPESIVFLSDISDEAINVAAKNKVKHNADISILKGDMLEPFIKDNLKADVIVSNPPYIGSIDTVDEQTLKYEPHLALFASPNTFFYEKLFQACDKVLNDPGLICLEIGEDMVDPLTELIKTYFPDSQFKFFKDMYSKFRFLIIIRDKRETLWESF